MEVRIAGINIPTKKHLIIALTSIYGIGYSTSKKVCHATNVAPDTKVSNLTETDVEKIRSEIAKYQIEGELRRTVMMNIKRKMDIGCYEGIRHRRGLPLSSRTRTNARTRKGKRKPIKK